MSDMSAPILPTNVSVHWSLLGKEDKLQLADEM